MACVEAVSPAVSAPPGVHQGRRSSIELISGAAESRDAGAECYFRSKGFPAGSSPDPEPAQASRVTI